MDYKIIQEIIKTMDNSKLTELEINWQGIILKMKKGGSNLTSGNGFNAAINEDKQSQIFCKNDTEEEHDDILCTEYDEKDCSVVKSPIVGTFYASPGTDKPPFAAVGQTVKKGQVLCIIEAMKLLMK